MRKWEISHIVTLTVNLAMILWFFALAYPADIDDYKIYLASREIISEKSTGPTMAAMLGQLKNKHAIIQLESIPRESEKTDLENNGIKLLDYIPNYAWYAYISSQANMVGDRIRTIIPIENADKISPHILAKGIAERGLNNDNTANVLAIFFGDVADQNIEAAVKEYGAAEKIMPQTWQVTLKPEDLLKFAALDIVQWIENVPPDKIAYLNYVRPRVDADEVQTNPYNLHGNGYVAAMWDAGAAWTHTDYSSRLTVADGSSSHFHATLVAGVMAGDGSRSQACGGSQYLWRGIATQAEIISYDWNNPTGEHSSAINTYHADVSQNSWGWDDCQVGYCDDFGDYDSYSRVYDMIVRGLYGDQITIVGAAGNNGECATCSGSLPDYPYGTVAGPIATSKNALSVSCTYSSNDGWWSESSRGPTDDGRIKPDLCAPGCGNYAGVKSTYTNNCYNDDYCGTSDAAPVVSGAAILLYEEYNYYYGEDPYSSTVRALLYQSAQDLGTSGPDYMYGYGRINIKNAVDIIIDDGGNGFRIKQNEINNSEVITYDFNVPADLTVLKVTLAWDDKEAAAGAGIKLVNNLNLELENPSHVIYYPYILDPANPGNAATQGVDNRNNIEQVKVQSPEDGSWIVRVSGSAVPYYPQKFSLVGEFTPAGCDYLPGDANGDGNLIGSDVTFMVNFFRGVGSHPPDSCWNDSAGEWLYSAADANGDCRVIGSDITFLVNYFRSLQPIILYCPLTPPMYGGMRNRDIIKHDIAPDENSR